MMEGLLTATWLATLLLSLPLDRWPAPSVRPWRERSAKSVGLHLAAVSALFLVFLSLWGRPASALVCTLGLLSCLIAINQAKVKALREPVVFSDLALFAQSLRHPRLYFPYVSGLHLLAPLVALGLLTLVILFDPTYSPLPTPALWLMWGGLLGIQMHLAKGLSLSLDPVLDQAQHGFYGTFVAYLLNGLSRAERHRIHERLNESPYGPIAIQTGKKSGPGALDLPDLVVIQSESFFDIRKTGLRLAPGLLDHFDKLRSVSLSAGALDTPAWGANTMRTEHAFLSGIPNATLGYARFYPYAFVNQAVPALPRSLQKKGYRCTAVHPYPADFFRRRQVFPRMGFDTFIDEAHFAKAERAGPYVSDAALTDHLIHTLEQAHDQPQFLFAITMENHGPLYLEAANAAEAAALYQSPDGLIHHDLTVYLRHLAHADAMLGRLQAFLRQRPRKTLLCFYGDHVPSLGPVYTSWGATPQDSDYVIWANHAQAQPRQPPGQRLTPEQLGLTLAQFAGLR